MEQRANFEVREALRRAQVSQWEIADKVGCTEWTLCRKLRHELTADDREQIYRAIEEITRERAARG